MAKIKWAGLLLFTVLCYFLVAEVDSLSCDRDTSSCIVTHRKIYRTASQSFAVDDLTGADLAELPSTRSRNAEDVPGVRVVILTSRGSIPLMNHATGLGIQTMGEEVAAIRAFAKNASARRLEVEHRNGVVAFAAAAFGFVFAGAVLLAFLR
jgi:hypothetical protein